MAVPNSLFRKHNVTNCYIVRPLENVQLELGLKRSSGPMRACEQNYVAGIASKQCSPHLSLPPRVANVGGKYCLIKTVHFYKSGRLISYSITIKRLNTFSSHLNTNIVTTFWLWTTQGNLKSEFHE